MEANSWVITEHPKESKNKKAERFLGRHEADTYKITPEGKMFIVKSSLRIDTGCWMFSQTLFTAEEGETVC